MFPLGSIECNLRTEFHLIRHFQKLDEEVIQRMLSGGYTAEQVATEMAVTGSRFRPYFATSVKGLLARFTQYPFIEALSGNQHRQFVFTGHATDFPEGVGTLGVIGIDFLSENSRKSLKRIEDRPEYVKYVEVDELPNTFLFTAILKPLNAGFLLISAFPGGASMPLPNEKMNAKEYEACRMFWDRHVFLKVRNVGND